MVIQSITHPSALSVGMGHQWSAPFKKDIHLLSDIDRNFALVELVDDLKDPGIYPFGAVTGE